VQVRGTLVNLGFYAHAAQAVGGALLPPRACWAALFFGLFGWFSCPPSSFALSYPSTHMPPHCCFQTHLVTYLDGDDVLS